MCVYRNAYVTKTNAPIKHIKMHGNGITPHKKYVKYYTNDHPFKKKLINIKRRSTNHDKNKFKALLLSKLH